jgi:Zn-finger nucleic acid-binding protein
MTESLTMLTCPKCTGQMRAYERNGVTVDQCADCRGIFLDRGELERLIDAEDAYYQPPTSAPTYPPMDPRGAGQRGRGHDRGHGSGRKRGGFLGDLFD